MSERDELRARVEAKKKQLEADLAAKKADAEGARNEATKKIRAKLDELNATLEKGWDDLSEAAAAKLNAWLE